MGCTHGIRRYFREDMDDAGTAAPPALPTSAASSSPDPRGDRYAALVRMSTEMTNEAAVDVFLQHFIHTAYHVLHCERVQLFLKDIDEDGSSIRHFVTPAQAPKRFMILSTWRDCGSMVSWVGEKKATLNFASDGDCRELELDDLEAGIDSALCMPLKVEGDEVQGVLVAVNKRPCTSGPQCQFDSLDEDMLGLLVAIVQQKLLAQRFFMKKASKLDSWLSLISGSLEVSSQNDVHTFIATILLRAQTVFDCDQCSLYAVDSLHDELVGYEFCVASNDKLVKRRTEIQGLRGVVATTGEIVNVEDAWKDDRFPRDRDIETGYRTRTLLIAPLKTSKGTVVALLECANKFLDQPFSDQDEREIVTLSALFADLLQRILLQSNFAALIEQQSSLDRDLKDMLEGYYSTPRSHRSEKSRRSSRSVSLGKDYREHTDANLSVVECMGNWDFDHWSMLSHHCNRGKYFLYVRETMEKINLDDEVDFADVGKAVSALQARYSKTAQYHTWAHAFSTFHLSSIMLEEACLDMFPSLDLLALLLAALGHDVEHQGFNNQFLINCRDTLALRYNDISVLENHHASVTCTILEDKITKALGTCATHFRRVIVTAILGTDMAKHREAVEWLTRAPITKDQLDVEATLQLGSVILHCADLAHPTLPWPLHRRLSVQIQEEFFMQYTEEERLGLPSLPFMGKDPKNMVGLAPSQVGFIKFVVLPLWSALDSALEGVDAISQALKKIGENRDSWQQIEDSGEEPADS